MSILRVEASVRERLGLDPSSLGATALPKAIEQRMKARGARTSEDYLGILAIDATETEALAAELVVPETWFFRGGRALFAKMAEFVAARAAAQPGQVVRVLSIPCSTGEEPYSLAIAFQEQFIRPECYQIHAVDVSARHLERAAAARFTAFSFREAGPDIRPGYFRQDGDRWDLLPHLRQLVHFRNANITDPTFLAGEQPFDLIICRNVFIYLTLEGRRRAMASLDRLLSLNGLMCLTAGEADRLPPGQFTPAAPGEYGLYRRVCAENLTAGLMLTPAPIPMPPPRLAYVPSPVPIPVPELKPIVAVALEPSVVPTSAKVPSLDTARTLADAGRLAEARQACMVLLQESGVSASAYSLLGTIHLAEGHGEDAAEAFRRALYLDPDNGEAISHMIGICERKGNVTQAAALRRRLARQPRGDTK